MSEVQYRIDQCEGAVYAVTEAVASAENCAIDALPSLKSAINPDGLNAIYSGESDANLSVSFQYSDSYVLIYNKTVFVSSEEPDYHLPEV